MREREIGNGWTRRGDNDICVMARGTAVAVARRSEARLRKWSFRGRVMSCGE